MPITKQYLRWEATQQFGVIGSQASGICILNQWSTMLSKNRICASAACENLIFWDIKTGEVIEKISLSEATQNEPKGALISCLAYSQASNLLATGHADGTVRVFDCKEKEVKAAFAGHKGFVSCLAFDESGLQLVSGGKDTDIVLWDVVNNSGLFRLKGHKGAINKVAFMREHPSVLLSASSDTFIKVWDLNTQHCFKTLSGHRSEVWSFVLLKNDTQLISGGSDSELKVWRITFNETDREFFEEKMNELKAKRQKQLEILGEDVSDEAESSDIESDSFILFERYGTILRKSSEKVTDIAVDSTGRLLICHGKDNYFECFKILSEEELKIRLKNRLRKERKRLRQQKGGDEPMDVEPVEEITLSDEIEKLEAIRVNGKIKSLDIRPVRGGDHNVPEYTIAALLINNSLEFHNIKLQSNNDLLAEPGNRIVAFGHRNDVRAISISSDNLSILTASADAVKLWNKASCRCIMTINEDVNYPLCSLFAPGDKHAIIGTKTGKIQVLSMTTASVQSTVDASDSDKPIWSMAMLPDLTGIVTGSEDKTIKFWTFNLVLEKDADGQDSRVLTVAHERTLNTDEGVLCVKMSSNSKFVAFSLLDSTVKVHFADTFKFFLSLYGHKFPVLCMDISTDNSLIVTGSPDKNIKIWGMDFGDCHRSLFAHDDNIMCISFIPKTHQFFSASKDNKIKMWDADLFEKVTTLEGHHSEIWAMAIAPCGKYLVTASHDRSIRIWSKTNEPLILEEEKELENEKLFEKEFEDNSDQAVVPGEVSTNEVGLAQKKTLDSLKTVERIIESVDIFNEEQAKLATFNEQLKAYEAATKREPNNKSLVKPVREPLNPYMLVARTECPYRFMLEVLLKIKMSQLEETLLQLPYSYTCQLLTIIHELLVRRWEVELMCRIVCFIIRVNFGQITSTRSLVELLHQIRGEIHRSMSELTELVGVNNMALVHLEDIFESRENASLFLEVLRETKHKKSKKRKSTNKTAPIMTWT